MQSTASFSQSPVYHRHAFIHQHSPADVSIRQHTSAYVSIRQHASAYVSIRQHTSAYVAHSLLLCHLSQQTRPAPRASETQPCPCRPLCLPASPARCARALHAGAQRQNLYFCTSKASQMSTEPPRGRHEVHVRPASVSIRQHTSALAGGAARCHQVYVRPVLREVRARALIMPRAVRQGL